MPTENENKALPDDHEKQFWDYYEYLKQQKNKFNSFSHNKFFISIIQKG